MCLDQPSRASWVRRFAVESVAGNHRLLSVVSSSWDLSECAGLVLPHGVKQVRDGLPGEQLVPSSRRTGNHRAAEYFRWYLDENAVNGLDVCAPYGIPGRRSSGHYRATFRTPRTLSTTARQPSRGRGPGLLLRAALSRHPRNTTRGEEMGRVV